MPDRIRGSGGGVEDMAAIVSGRWGRVAQPLVAPSVRPATNCFCRTKKMTSVGRAITTDPAATRLKSVKNSPRRLLIELVTGNLSPDWSSTVAQKNSL